MSERQTGNSKERLYKFKDAAEGRRRVLVIFSVVSYWFGSLLFA